MKNLLKDVAENILYMFIAMAIFIIVAAIIGVCYRILGPLFGTLSLIIICAIIATLKDNDPYKKYKL